MSETQQRNGRKRLPIGIQDFRSIREDDCYYVDKTQLIHQLITEGRHYFLSRPRRFGKSLLLDTTGELFAGNEELFRGLAIHDQWDWSNRHPVVRLSFDGKYNEPGDIEQYIHGLLEGIEETEGLDPPESVGSAQVRLLSLLRRLHQMTGRQAVVLVDEYDKPILDVLEDVDLAKANRDYLRGFYGVIKGSAKHVRFVFVTGVSMFSKVNLFSGLNNLTDISLIPRFSTICGYTDDDIDRIFAPELDEGLDRDEMRHWYNGYNWLGESRVYNPYDVLLLFYSGEFKSHWFQTGTPTFLYQLMTRDRIPAFKIDSDLIGHNRLMRFDVGDIELRSLMFQSGYLTIAAKQHVGGETRYALEYPNREVRENFNTELLSRMGRDELQALDDGRALLKLLESNDFEGFEKLLRSAYATIPHEWYRKNALERYEGHYLSVLYAHFNAVGAEARAEESTSLGQSDLVVGLGGQVFVMEAKVVEDEDGQSVAVALDAAIQQLRERRYAEKYGGRNDRVHLLALAFGTASRNLVRLKSETF